MHLAFSAFSAIRRGGFDFSWSVLVSRIFRSRPAPDIPIFACSASDPPRMLYCRIRVLKRCRQLKQPPRLPYSEKVLRNGDPYLSLYPSRDHDLRFGLCSASLSLFEFSLPFGSRSTPWLSITLQPSPAYTQTSQVYPNRTPAGQSRPTTHTDRCHIEAVPKSHTTAYRYVPSSGKPTLRQ